MAEQKGTDPATDGTHETPGSPGEEVREGLLHLFNAARKIAKTAEPHVARSLDDAERVLGKIGRGGEAVATEVGKEVATLAAKVAERLRTLAERAEGGAAGDRPPPSPPGETNDETTRTQR